MQWTKICPDTANNDKVTNRTLEGVYVIAIVCFRYFEIVPGSKITVSIIHSNVEVVSEAQWLRVRRNPM